VQVRKDQRLSLAGDLGIQGKGVKRRTSEFGLFFRKKKGEAPLLAQNSFRVRSWKGKGPESTIPKGERGCHGEEKKRGPRHSHAYYAGGDLFRRKKGKLSWCGKKGEKRSA